MQDGTFKIFNLCIERTYDTSFFRDQVAWYPCHDHNVPPLHMMHNLAMSAHRWLESDERNVVAMHCKGGKGAIEDIEIDEEGAIVEFGAESRSSTDPGPRGTAPLTTNGKKAAEAKDRTKDQKATIMQKFFCQ